MLWLRALICAAELVPVGEALKAANTAIVLQLGANRLLIGLGSEIDRLRGIDACRRRRACGPGPGIAGVPGDGVRRAADERCRRSQRGSPPTRSGG